MNLTRIKTQRTHDNDHIPQRDMIRFILILYIPAVLCALSTE